MTHTYRTALPEAALWQDLTARANATTETYRGPLAGRVICHPYRVKTQPPTGFTLDKGQKSRSGLYYHIVVSGQIAPGNGHTRVTLHTKLSVVRWLLAGFLVAGSPLVHYFI